MQLSLGSLRVWQTCSSASNDGLPALIRPEVLWSSSHILSGKQTEHICSHLQQCRKWRFGPVGLPETEVVFFKCADNQGRLKGTTAADAKLARVECENLQRGCLGVDVCPSCVKGSCREKTSIQSAHSDREQLILLIRQQRWEHDGGGRPHTRCCCCCCWAKLMVDTWAGSFSLRTTTHTGWLTVHLVSFKGILFRTQQQTDSFYKGTKT